MNKSFRRQIQELEHKLEDNNSRLSELSKASGEAWVTLREGLESARDSLSNALAEAASKFKQ